MIDRHACPKCGRVINAQFSADGSDRKPKAGDVSVCAYCATLLIFDAGKPPAPIEPNASELASMQADPEVWAELQRVIAVIKRFNSSHENDPTKRKDPPPARY